MSTTKGELRRAAILDAAEKTLLHHGHAGLSLRAVATAASIRLGHLQHYFPSRSRLVEALLDRVLRRSLQRLAQHTEGTPHDADPATLVETLLAEQHDATLVRVFVEIWALAASDREAATAVRGFYRTYTEMVADHIGRLCPYLTPRSRWARAHVFIALLEGAALMRSGIAADATEAGDAHLRRTALVLLSGRYGDLPE
ncbi:TetR/AcrR family transcriptional regulator [Salinactinospora qingdaonensis]|uniref:HTH tetR-type domain-containing protein n=1 Tax=Salinactinospora qingdaonensis TaxID=702744 RepID=A0ABP7GCA2_9ACTN